MHSILLDEFNEHIDVCKKTIKSSEKLIIDAANLCIEAFKRNNKILIFGNGGSAADAQHIAAELVGRFNTERKGLPAIALTTDTSLLTSIGNDYGYSHIFERQVGALAKKGDVVIGISTGGTSTNVINALNLANYLGCKTIGLSGKGGGEFESLCHININIPSNNTPRIQEMHIVIGHLICHLIDLEYQI